MTDQPQELYAVADFCLVPIGTGETSVAAYVAECHRVLEKTGLAFKVLQIHLHRLNMFFSGYGTNIEGPWTAVCDAIQQCHAAVHAKGAPRIATDIRIGTRTDRAPHVGEMNDRKLTRVQDILAENASAPGATS
ncbi:YkoF-like protein [Exidia glandulosa HHB12029]|uniref:YkoF-like protein n=1 Tax=Exidia glandulosa HHB12029 TaxID=1314781 RepID=A0A165DWQ7_EXIGL|nr:YkoF-like protein [Exidia glandulosa HHB12029]